MRLQFKVHDDKYYLAASNYIVAMGSLQRNVRRTDSLYIEVTRIVGHANYNPDTFQNDIAILTLASFVPANHPNVQPINLATHGPIVGSNCIISGWGRLTYMGFLPESLQAANVTIRSSIECNQRDRYAGAVLNGMFCAGTFVGVNISDSW